ncbi:hypothetical protein L195_g037298 [Trifolium pratense]|uniref:Uncharacterized protein n=1 Tax=Trifolium pratense TaxID=57577 RepID=A0A2K3LRW2_TRIPR|nr:hypothetical protein L195_g037298 [Trifolium pratense]
MEEVQTSKAEVNKATSQSLLIMVSLNVAAWQSFVKMLADKQRRETEEIKEDEEETTNNAFTGKSETSNDDLLVMCLLNILAPICSHMFLTQRSLYALH